MNDIFKILDFILKKKSFEISDDQYPSSFIVNRWLSMSDPVIAQIVNATTNRWISNSGICTDNSYRMCNFLKAILPKINKKIKYIKQPQNKNEKEIEFEGYQNIELSFREIKMYEETLDFLKTNSK